MDERALPTIHICLSDEVHSEKIAASLWLKLESLCMMKSLTNNLYLKHCLFMLWMEEGASIKTHLDEFNSIVVDLRSIDVTVEREDEVLVLLCSLPDSNRYLRDAFFYLVEI